MHRPNDFQHAVEGELVWIDEPCATDRRDLVGGCDCGRAFARLSSHRATTIAQVRDPLLSRDDVMAALVGYFESAGYGIIPPRELEPELAALLRFAAALDEGTIVERRLDIVRPR